MSRENVELVRRFFEAIARGEQGETPIDTMQRLAHEDVVYVEDPKWPDSDTYRGRAAVAECWTRYDDLMGAAVTASVTDVRDAGDQIVAIVRISGRTRAGGMPFDHTWGYICRMRDGRMSYFRACFDADEALEAAGLEE
jgi:ketosteroid isomerase-like protein